jgi:hypothetical protein
MLIGGAVPLRLVGVVLELVDTALVNVVGVTSFCGESICCITPLPNRAAIIRTETTKTARYLVRFEADFPVAGGGAEDAVCDETSTLAPHDIQNSASGDTASPQEGHRIGNNLLNFSN